MRIHLILFSLTLVGFKPVNLQQSEDCTTPDKRPGRCIPLNQCPLLYTLLLKLTGDEPLRYKPDAEWQLSQSQCGVEDEERPLRPLVCCPTTRDPPDVSGHPNLHHLNQTACGQNEVRRIIEGQAVGLTEYRWMVLLAYKDDDRYRFRCGGTLITKRYVLTAAHCVTDNKNLVFVRLGEYNISSPIDCEDEENCLEQHQDVKVVWKMRHQNFTINVPELGYDVGLVRLERDVQWDGININIVCLPVTRQQWIMSKNMIVTGWGVTKSGEASPVLLMATVPVIPVDECYAIYKTNNNITIDETVICAGDHRDSCRGDSGGPLQRRDEMMHYQHGIVSYGPRDCGTVGVPGVYTDVRYYMDWILDHLV